MKKLLSGLGGLLILGAVVAAFIAYFVRSHDSKIGVFYDGFGRELSEAPWLLKFLIGQDYMWPGWIWFFLDIPIFWGLIGLAIAIQKFGDRF